MKTILLDRDRPVLVDFNKEELTSIETTSFWSFFEGMFIVPEDCEIKYKQDKKTVVKKAEKGDLVFICARRPYTKERIAVVKNADLKANVVSYLADRAAKQASLETEASFRPICSDCEECSCLGD